MKLHAVFGLLLTLFATGCFTTGGKPGSTDFTSAPAATNKSHLRVGDQVQVRLETITLTQPQVHDLVIDDNGDIALPLVDRIRAAGLTTTELAEKIRAAYVPRFYVRCNVNVLVASRFFYVGGEVRSPGRQAWTKDVTLLKAINICGGFNDFANRSRVELTRGGKKQVFNANLLRQYPEKDVPIQPGDSIHVPRSIF